MRRYVAGRTDITLKARESYEWAIPHIEAGLGAIPIARLDREDVAGWIEGLAAGGQLSRRSVQICRTVLRAALAEAVEEGLIPRSPAARVALPRSVAKPTKQKEIEAWSAGEIDRFLEASRDHRWAIGFRLGVLYGLRRSEVLALRWDDLDAKAKTLRVDESLVAVRTGAAWSDAKNERSRRRIPLDDETIRRFSRRRAEQATERLLAGAAWEDNDLMIATRGRVGSSSLARTTGRSPCSSRSPACRGSRPTACATPQPRTWSPAPPTSDSSGRSQTSSATALRC